MNNKGLYWIALGVLVLGLNSEYQKGRLPLASRVADRTQAVYCQVAAKAERTWVLAKLLTGDHDATLGDQFLARRQAEIDRVVAERQADVDRVIAENQAGLDRAMDLRQADLDRVQQKLDRIRVVMDRVQVEKLRKIEKVGFNFADVNVRRVVVCPQTGVRVMVDAEPEVHVDVDSQ